jgi:hypothetical protein
MPILRPARSIAAALLVVATLLGVSPAPAAALEPPRPLPDHRPAFVTETDTRPWIDCLWASASMLLDKWTNGEVRRTHGQLRRLSGDRGGGSSFEDMRVAFRKLGFRINLNRDGDSTLTWGQLLSRLGKGAGAVVLGDYSDLPRYHGRWDYAFWRKKGKADNHAIYVERFDRKRGRVWVMDPLARGAWKGEWMSIWALKRFAWFSGGRVQAITTPTARPAPFAGVRATSAQVGLSTGAISATWSLRAARRWRYAGADVHVSVSPADDPILAAAMSAVVNPRTTADAAPKRPVAAVSGRTLRVSAALPGDPGAYVVAMSLTDRRFGARFVASEPVAVFVPGLRRAALRVRAQERLPEPGQRIPVTVAIANPSGISWADTIRPSADEREDRLRNTRLTGTWVRLEPSTGDAAAPDTRRTVDLGPIALEPGSHTRVSARLAVPTEPGRWALVIDVVDDVDGSFAAQGSAPAVAIFRVLPAAVAEGVE